MQIAKQKSNSQLISLISEFLQLSRGGGVCFQSSYCLQYQADGCGVDSFNRFEVDGAADIEITRRRTAEVPFVFSHRKVIQKKKIFFQTLVSLDFFASSRLKDLSNDGVRSGSLP